MDGEAQPALPTKYKATPLPPDAAGETEELFEWCRQIIAVQMGRRRRLPSLEPYGGSRACEVVDFLNRKGFRAHIVDFSELSLKNSSVEDEGNPDLGTIRTSVPNSVGAVLESSTARSAVRTARDFKRAG